MKKSVGTKADSNHRKDSLLQSALKNGGGPKNELQSAWDSLRKAKSLLYRAEHKLTDISKPSSADILWHLPNFLYGLLDQENLSDIPKDYFRSDLAVEERFSTPSTKRKVSYAENRHDLSGGYDRSIGGANDRIVDDKGASDHLNLSEIKSVDSSGISFAPTLDRQTQRRVPSKSFASKNESSANVTRDTSGDLTTSSTAVRETDVRHLNDAIPRQKQIRSNRSEQPVEKPIQLRHVDIKIPASSSERTTQIRIREPPRGASESEMERNARNLVLYRTQNVLNSKPADDLKASDYKVGFEKTTESKRYNHSNEERAIVSHYNLPDKPIVAPTRKVALGPPAPTYKGFNEPQQHLRRSHLRVEWMNESDLGSRNNGSKLRTKRAEAFSDRHHLVSPNNNESFQKMNRVVAVRNDDVAKKDIISTNSWRVGARLERDLGLTFTTTSKKTKLTENVNKNANKEEDDDGELPSDDYKSLPDVAKSILKDLLPGKYSSSTT